MCTHRTREVVVVGMARSPIGNFLGALSTVPAVELAKTVAKEAMSRARVKPEDIDEVTLGTVFKHGMKGNPARQIQIDLGIPGKGPASTIEQQCASSLRALEIAVQQIQLNKTDAALVCGVESMSNIPYIVHGIRKGLRMGPGKIEDAMQYDGLIDVFSGESIMRTAENVAERYHVSRQEQDE